MRRRLLIAPLLATALVAAATTAAVGDVKLPASVKVKECSIENASAVFVGRMREIEGSQSMWLRFRLLEKGDTGFHALKAPGLGRWRKSKPAVGTFAYRQAVRGLESGSLYRAEVDFRWYDAEGTVVGTARAPLARLPPVRRAAQLTATPVGTKSLRQDGVVRYLVLVTNEGIAPATGVPVRLSVDGDVVDTVTVPCSRPRSAACSRSRARPARPR